MQSHPLLKNKQEGIKMKLKLLILTLSLVVAFCNREKEELATYKDGNVTRKEFRGYYDFRNIPVNEKTTSVQAQSQILENLAIQILVDKEIDSSKENESPFYKKIFELSEIQFLSNLIMKEYLKDFKKKEKLNFVTVQFLLLLPNKGNPDEELEKLNSLKSDDEIFKYISENTQEEQRKPLGGILEPLCTNCKDDTFLPIFQEGISANDKAFRKTNLEDKILIYRIYERKQVSEKDLESYFKKVFQKFRDMAIEFQNNSKTDEEKEKARYYAEDEPNLSNKVARFAERAIQTFEAKAWDDEYERRKKEIGFESTEILEGKKGNNLSSYPLNTLLFKTNNLEYKLENLNQEFSEYLQIRGNQQFNEAQEKWNFLHNIVLPKYLIVATDKGRSIKETDNYKNNIPFLKRNVAWISFIKRIQDSIQLTEDEIKNAYEMGKNFAYSQEVGGKKIPLPFEKVRAQISEELKQNKLRSSVEDKISKMKETYSLKIFTEKLKAGEI